MDRKNIDDLTVEIMNQQVADDLRKALPPRLAYRLRHWFQQQGRRVRLSGTRKVAQQVAQKIEQAMALKELKKNQFMARVHDDGVVRLDFGAAVPEPVRKAAMDWAKRKGLKPVESSLAKNIDSVFSITYATGRSPDPASQIVSQHVWEIAE